MASLTNRCRRQAWGIFVDAGRLARSDKELLIILPCLRQYSASPVALNVSVIVHHPALTNASWREKTILLLMPVTSPPHTFLLFFSSSPSKLPCCSPFHLRQPSSTSSHLSQSIPHKITRWHARCCPGNHCYTTVAWSPSSDKPRAQHACVLQSLGTRHLREVVKGWREGWGWEGHALTAAVRPVFYLMVPPRWTLWPLFCSKNIRDVEKKKVALLVLLQ